MMKLLSIGFMSLMLLACGQASQDVDIADAWVRAVAPGQEVGAAYMTLTSPVDTTLVSVESPVAGTVEIHSMTMENDVMKMRMLETLELKAGKPEVLAPGGFHLMLFDLNSKPKSGDAIDFKLNFKTAQGEARVQSISLPVKSSAD